MAKGREITSKQETLGIKDLSRHLEVILKVHWMTKDKEITSKEVNMCVRLSNQCMCIRRFRGYLACWLCIRREKNLQRSVNGRGKLSLRG